MEAKEFIEIFDLSQRASVCEKKMSKYVFLVHNLSEPVE